MLEFSDCAYVPAKEISSQLAINKEKKMIAKKKYF